MSYAFISACASSSALPTPVNISLARPDVTQAYSSEHLEIQPLDILNISVFNVDELSDSYQVDFEGYLKIPLIEKVSTTSLNSFEMARKLESLLGKQYLQDPDVTVTLTSSETENVTVDGSVNNPGIYPLKGNLSLLQAVALAGGPDEYAATDKVIIIRRMNQKRMIAGYSLTDIRKGTAEDPKIYGNDVVVMDGSTAKRNYREFLRSIPLFGLFLAL